MLGEGDGRKLSVDMLLELRDMGLDPASIEQGVGQAQENVVRRYLDNIYGNGSSAVRAGFAAVLTDFLASALDGGVTDPEFYESVC